MAHRTKRVTIGIPTYNRINYLKETIKSCLLQDYENLEILISDNASTDGTEDYVNLLIKDHPESIIVYHKNEVNLGAEANWVYCWKHATGDYFIMLSDDDILMEGAVSAMVQQMTDETALVIGQTIYIDSDGNTIGSHINPHGTLNWDEFWIARLSKGYHDTPSSVMIRLGETRPYLDTIAKTGTTIDVSLDLLLSRNKNIKCIDYITTLYRIHRTRDTNNILRCVVSHIKMIEYMRTNGIEESKLILLKTYSQNTIYTYVIYAFESLKIREMLMCIGLVYKHIDKNILKTAGRLLWELIVFVIKKSIYCLKNKEVFSL